jgi:hypothetical protein
VHYFIVSAGWLMYQEGVQCQLSRWLKKEIAEQKPKTVLLFDETRRIVATDTFLC